MRKVLLGLVTIILFVFSIYIVVYGLGLGSLEVNGVPAISEENDVLESKIQTASKLKNSDYPQATALLESAYKKLMTEKESYEQILALGVDENGQPLSKIQEYEVEKIWITMGNHAKKQGVELKLDVTQNNSITGTYDMNFTVTGGYIQITDFLYDIEKDSTLVWKLENFKMQPGTSTENLSATFTCKDIKLNITKNSASTATSTDKAANENSTSNNNTTTNSTTNTNSNTTNSTTTNTSTNTTN